MSEDEEWPILHYSPGNTVWTREIHGGDVEGEITSNVEFVNCRICRIALGVER